jgi:hypothetical protein
MATQKKKAGKRDEREQTIVVHVRFRESSLRQIDTAAILCGLDRPGFIRAACQQTLRTGLNFPKNQSPRLAKLEEAPTPTKASEEK